MDNSPSPKLDFKIKKMPARRNFLAAFFISCTWGIFGVDRMYLGKWWTGLLKLVTIGGCGVWLVVDIISISKGNMRDAWGRELHGASEYQPFVHKFSLIFSIVAILLALVVGVILFAALSYLYQELDSKGLWNGFRGSLGDPSLNIEDVIQGY